MALKRIHSFLKSSLLDWEGKVSATVFLSGCNFKCPWCQNYSLIKEVSNYDEKDIIDFIISKRNWIDGVVLCGGEPLLKNDIVGFIKKIKDAGFLLKIDTNGSNPWLLKNLIDEKLIDYVALDLKSRLTEDKYEKATGGRKNILKKVLESMSILIKSSIDFEFRTTLVPKIVEKDDIVFNIKFIPEGKKYIIQKFSPYNCRKKEFKKIKNYTDEYLKSIVQKIKKHRRKSWIRN